jgi:hypothetical protein
MLAIEVLVALVAEHPAAFPWFAIPYDARW